jgi:hypothetical protein
MAANQDLRDLYVAWRYDSLDGQTGLEGQEAQPDQEGRRGHEVPQPAHGWRSMHSDADVSPSTGVQAPDVLGEAEHHIAQPEAREVPGHVAPPGGGMLGTVQAVAPNAAATASAIAASSSRAAAVASPYAGVPQAEGGEGGRAGGYEDQGSRSGASARLVIAVRINPDTGQMMPLMV